MQPGGSQIRGFRPLLPRPQASQGPPGTDTTGQLAARRPHTRIACERCRRRKIKCDGTRPTCSACVQSGSSCAYLSADPNESRSSAIKRKFDEAQDRVSSHEELYTLLKTRSQAEANEMLRRIRAGVDVDTILRYVKDGDLLLQLHLAPEARLRYSFPDFASWPTIFRDPEDPYLRTQLLDFESEVQPTSDSLSDTVQAVRQSPLHLDSHVYHIPYHAAQAIDPRLSSVRASAWTSVTADDALVSNLLAIYFQFEYPRTHYFQKDLFLDDLARGKTNFCSSLLVNCILANAAHGLTSDAHRVEFWSPRSLPYAFLAEAKRLWDIETTGDPKLTTIHAALLLTLRYGADGADKIAIPFMLKALELADKMDLFTRKETLKSRTSLGRAFTAWALYSWHGMTFYYELKLPLVLQPPATPLPDYRSISKFTGEIYLKYPLQTTLTPVHLGATFRAHVQLNMIMVEILVAAHQGGALATAPPTLPQALHFYKSLTTWYKSLPTELQADRIVMPHHLQIHMEYCLVLINLFEPWKTGPDSAIVVDDEGRTIGQIGMLARARLETLIRLYYLRHSFDALDAVLIMFLLLLGSISVRVLALGDAADSGTGTGSGQGQGRDASTFLLCAKGLHDQGRNQYLGTLMFNMLSGLVDPKNEALVGDLARIRAEFKGTEVRTEYVHMDWPVYRWVHPENESMGRLLEGVDALSVSGESGESELLSLGSGSRGATPGGGGE